MQHKSGGSDQLRKEGIGTGQKVDSCMMLLERQNVDVMTIRRAKIVAILAGKVNACGNNGSTQNCLMFATTEGVVLRHKDHQLVLQFFHHKIAWKRRSLVSGAY